ncbi:hypothetical protein M0813_06785 [Anaeramoeba flamelloides]|uniref:Uncharacterized protein n=1 Tax=Anaeramoeba flamelloides TaxID=1746091 RepID=A0ABQ8XDB0_9EUKA|nr:hypothetical protein M0813_06785 [Anaeramoeba flamelloides]
MVRKQKWISLNKSPYKTGNTRNRLQYTSTKEQYFHWKRRRNKTNGKDFRRERTSNIIRANRPRKNRETEIAKAYAHKSRKEQIQNKSILIRGDQIRDGC